MRHLMGLIIIRDVRFRTLVIAERTVLMRSQAMDWWCMGEQVITLAKNILQNKD